MIKARCECGNPLKVIDTSNEIVVVERCAQCEKIVKKKIYDEQMAGKKEAPKKT